MSVRVLTGDCRKVLASMAAGSVHCVVTSPPYWGLRDYKIPPTAWGGDAGCHHEWGARHETHDEREATTNGKTRTTDRFYGDESRRFDGDHQKHTSGAFCRHCGAWRGVLGHEPTVDLYVAHIVEVFREVRRVLRADGTLWLNYGDCYTSRMFSHDSLRAVGITNGDFKPKNLVMMPARVALALQADGWWLRSEIIWAKSNPMPESVIDRPTSAHEKIFLLTKSAKYFYDAEAVREQSITGDMRRPYGSEGAWQMDGRPVEQRHGGEQRKSEKPDGSGRNLRNVWTIAAEPFSQGHFAVFPTKLVEPCINAGCPEDGTVLDPFGGAGTTGLVADRLGRDAILIDLNPEYADMARKRIEGDAPLLAEVTP